MGQDASPTATSLDAIYAYDGVLVLTRGNITRMVQETCMIDSSKLKSLIVRSLTQRSEEINFAFTHPKLV